MYSVFSFFTSLVEWKLKNCNYEIDHKVFLFIKKWWWSRICIYYLYHCKRDKARYHGLSRLRCYKLTSTKCSTSEPKFKWLRFSRNFCWLFLNTVENPGAVLYILQLFVEVVFFSHNHQNWAHLIIQLFQKFSGNNSLAKGIKFTHVWNFQHVFNSRYVSFKVRKVRYNMKTYSILDYWILEWLAVALCLPSMYLNGQQISEL